MRLNERGVTLIELMTVLLIVSILSAIAIPSYSQYVKRSHRAEAKAALLEDAQFLERNRTITNSYATDGGGEEITPDSLPVQRTPKTGAAAKYTIAIDATATTFTLTATPVAGGPMADDSCGKLTLTNTGLKSSTGGDDVTCWNK